MARRPVTNPRPEDQLELPVVALVGRPNVGKSSLFNRLVGGRPALVEDRPGVTRDRRYGICEWQNYRFRLVDTGGLDPSADGILGAMRTQTLRAVEEAAVLVLVLDAVEGLTAVDTDVAQLLRRTGKPVFLAVNKVDSAVREGATADAFALGLGPVFPVSAIHGRAIGDMLDGVVAALGDSAKVRDEPAPVADEARPIRIAFVGKPNAGKSSLVNRLLGDDRVLVHDQPGTTRDPIDTPFRTGDQDFVLVDTAGLRRRRTIETLTDAVSAKMARDQLARADVAALVIDAQIGATAEDAKLASLIEESGRAAVIVINKSDLVPRKQVDAVMAASREQLQFVSYAPFVFTSAVTGRGVAEIAASAKRVFEQWSRRVPTSDLNRHFEEMVTRRTPPSGPAGKYIRLYYITQAAVCPPTFFVSTNAPLAVGQPYRRYLVNQLRQVYEFAGSPIKMIFRSHGKKGSARSAAP